MLNIVVIVIGSVVAQSPAQQLPIEAPNKLLPADTSSFPENTIIIEQDESKKRHDTLSLGYLGLILLGMLLFGLLRVYRHVQQTAQITHEALKQKQRERQQLLYDIVNLDDQYAQRMIEEHLYLSERKRIKQQLIELTIQCKALL